MPNAETTSTEAAATVAEQGAPVTPRKAASKKAATSKKGAAKAKKPAKAAKAAGKNPARAPKKTEQPATEKAPRAESKGSKILELIGRPKGATLAEIMKATEWQAHSVRGFLSTAAKHGIKIESTKTETGDRVYSIKK